MRTLIKYIAILILGLIIGGICAKIIQRYSHTTGYTSPNESTIPITPPVLELSEQKGQTAILTQSPADSFVDASPHGASSPAPSIIPDPSTTVPSSPTPSPETSPTPSPDTNPSPSPSPALSPSPTPSPTPSPNQSTDSSPQPSFSPIVSPDPSPIASPAPIVAIFPDINGDGVVDIKDFDLLIRDFGHPYTIYEYNILLASFDKPISVN